MRTCSTPEHGGIADQISLAIEGGTFNVQTATCGGGTYCIICVGLASCAVNPNPTHVSVGSSSQATATGTYSNGSTEDDTSKSSWSSNATSIATVETKGNANPGLVSGVSPGTATVTVDDPSFESGKACGLFPTCTVIIVACSLPVGVPPTVTISGPADVPLRNGSDIVGVNTITLSATGNPAGGTFSWTTASSKVSLSNTSSATVTVTSVAASGSVGDVPVTVTYTLNNESGQATQKITVQQPTGLSIVTGTSSTTAEASCTFIDQKGNTQTGCGVTRTFMYQVRVSRIPLEVSGGPEHFTPPSPPAAELRANLPRGLLSASRDRGSLGSCGNFSR